MKKKFLTLFLAAMLTLSLAACGNEDSKTSSEGSGSQVEAGSELPKGEVGSVQGDVKAVKDDKKGGQSEVEPIEAALKNVNSASSMESETLMKLDMTVGANGQVQTMETVTTMNMVCFYDTLKIKMDMIVDMGQLGTQTMNVYIDTAEDGSMTTYMYDGQKWQSQVSGEIVLKEYDARRNMSESIGDTSVYTKEGIEEVNGARAYKYSYAMTGEEMKEALTSSGALSSVASLGITEAQLNSMLDDLGELVTYVWVDEETLYPVKYEMDMTEIMDKLMSGMFEAMGEQAQGLSMSISKMTMTMTCSNYNNATDFTVPDEAKSVN